METADRDKFIKDNNDIFTGLGTLKTNHKFKLKSNARPVAFPPRRVASKLKEAVKKKLDELVEQRTIEVVNTPSEWVHHLVIVEKPDGSLRLCLDPQELNKALADEFFLIPTIEELAEKIVNADYYTVLDLKDGFYQIELDRHASKVCTFSTAFGCYRFKRFPFGIKSGPELCQKLNQELFGHIPGVVVYLDDILITGKTKLDHDKVLAAVVELARKRDVKFNSKKLQYCLREIRYIGHIFSRKGMRADPERISSITKMPSPTSVKELQRFLGLVNYVRNFVPNMAQLTEPLRHLLKKTTEWQWLPAHEAATNVLRSVLTNSPVLKIFDASRHSVIQCDASKDGIGFCLLQDGRPVAYGSKSLTEAQINYGQIEKEFLAILMACKKFHYYIYGQKVTVETDHKPLVSLMMQNGAANSVRPFTTNQNEAVALQPGAKVHPRERYARRRRAITGIPARYM